jgi:hypothetical protein
MDCESSIENSNMTEGQSKWPRRMRLKHWPLGRSHLGFESRLMYECLPLCFCVVLSCVNRGLHDGLITRSKEPTKLEID